MTPRLLNKAGHSINKDIDAINMDLAAKGARSNSGSRNYVLNTSFDSGDEKSVGNARDFDIKKGLDLAKFNYKSMTPSRVHEKSLGRRKNSSEKNFFQEGRKTG